MRMQTYKVHLQTMMTYTENKLKKWKYFKNTISVCFTAVSYIMNFMQWQEKCNHHRFSRGACSAQTHAAHTDLNKRPQSLLLQQSLLLTHLSAFTHTHTCYKVTLASNDQQHPRVASCLSCTTGWACTLHSRKNAADDKLLRRESYTLIHNLSYLCFSISYYKINSRINISPGSNFIVPI